MIPQVEEKVELNESDTGHWDHDPLHDSSGTPEADEIETIEQPQTPLEPEDEDCIEEVKPLDVEESDSVKSESEDQQNEEE